MTGAIQKWEQMGNQIRIFFSDGGTGIVTILKDNVFNVFQERTQMGHRSKALTEEAKELFERKDRTVEYEVKEQKGQLIIITGALKIVVEDGFYVDVYDEEGTLLCQDYRGSRKHKAALSEKDALLLLGEGHEVNDRSQEDYPIQVMKSLDPEDCIYGLGDKTGFLNKRGYEYEMWNTDDPSPHVDCFKSLYKSIPFYITLKKKGVYGIFFDNTYRSYFDFGKEQADYCYFGAEKGNLDYYYIGGSSMAEVVTNYTGLTGRAPLPQLFSLGYQQSRWGYESKEEVMEVAEKYRELQIPCDTIHLDIDYMDHYKVFTWNKEAFGDARAFMDGLKKMGFKVVTIIDPGVKLEEGYDKYDEGVKNGYFATTPEGEIYVNAVWPGDAVYPDFGSEKVEKWWADNQKYLVDLGVRGVWNDMNEPASFRGELPQDVVFTDGDEKSDHAAMHNVYGHLMAKATYEGLKKWDKRRPYIITRACYAGSQKYATAWTGDNHSIWSHLQMAVPQLCNLGLSGMPFVGTDVGGFNSDPTPELMCRWVEVGAFSPLFRNHSAKGTIRQEPWQFDENVIQVHRKYINLRYRLLPYLYDLFWQEEKSGLPIMRPLVLHYEQDPNVRNKNDEFMFGDQMLVAPVLEQGETQKLVYLPEGTWFDYWTREKVEGGTYLIREAPIDVCPIYVKAGAILPCGKAVQYVGEQEEDTLILDLYEGCGSFDHYQDNGEDFAYQQGAFNSYHIEMEGRKLKLKETHQGYEKRYRKLELHFEGKVIEKPFLAEFEQEL